MCLCAATGLAYATLTAQYALLQLVLHGFEDDLAFELLGEIPRISKQENAASNVWWLVIFLVKMAFFVLLSQVNLSFTEPEPMVVVCYHTYYNCWVGQHSRFLADLSALHC